MTFANIRRRKCFMIVPIVVWFLIVVTCLRPMKPIWLKVEADHDPVRLDKTISHLNIPKNNHSSIPKILHQTFQSELVYENYRTLISSCLAQNSDWTYYLWRDSDALDLITKEFPQYLMVYLGFLDNLQRSDAIRYVVLHRFGGIYLDMDVECLQPFHPALTGDDAFIDQERVEQTQILWNSEFSAMNSAMGSVPGHPFYRLVADEVLTRKAEGNAFDTTGPVVLTRVFKEYRTWQLAKDWPVRLLPPSVISPLMDTQKNWKYRCNGALDTDLENPSWRERGCLTLQSKRWRMDDTDNGTIAVHRFLHLGYEFAMGLRKGTFNMTEAFMPRIAFYDNSVTDVRASETFDSSLRNVAYNMTEAIKLRLKALIVKTGIFTPFNPNSAG